MSESALTPATLPFGAVGKIGVGWWGVLTLIATEASLFGYLLFAYAFTAVQEGGGYLPNKPPALHLAGPNTLVLLLSSVAVWWGEAGIKRGARGRLLAGYGAGFALGLVFVAVQLKEWASKDFRLATSGYSSHYFTITGFHMAHVALGLVALALTFIWALLGYFDRDRHVPVLMVSAYWHFVDAVWLCVFSAFYLAPYLGTGA